MNDDALIEKVRRLLRRNRKVAIAHILVSLALLVLICTFVVNSTPFIQERFQIHHPALFGSLALGIACGFFVGMLIWQLFTGVMVLLRKGVIFRALEALVEKYDSEIRNEK